MYYRSDGTGNDEWVLFDVETDGLYPPIHIIEIAAQRFNGLHPSGEPFQVFIDHDIEIPPDATAIHGHTTEFIRSNGIAPSSAYAAFREFVAGRPLAAHYNSFDFARALTPELERLGEAPVGPRGICTWNLARRALPEHPSHALDALRSLYPLPRPEIAHTAIGDVAATAALLTDIIFPRLVPLGLDSWRKIAHFSDMKPVLRCRCFVEGSDYAAKQAEIDSARTENKRRKRIIEEVRSGQTKLADVLSEQGFLGDEAEVDFRGANFVFTGRMLWGTRPAAEKELAARGAALLKSSSVSDRVSHVVLGEHPDDGWQFRETKLRNALIRRLATGDRPVFLTETQFVSAL